MSNLIIIIGLKYLTLITKELIDKIKKLGNNEGAYENSFSNQRIIPVESDGCVINNDRNTHDKQNLKRIIIRLQNLHVSR